MSEQNTQLAVDFCADRGLRLNFCAVSPDEYDEYLELTAQAMRKYGLDRTDCSKTTEELTRPLFGRHPFVVVRPDGYIYANPSRNQLEETVIGLIDRVVGPSPTSPDRSADAAARVNPKEKSNA